MKICIVCTRFNQESLGGVERVILDLSKKYVEKGHQVTIICKRENGGLFRENWQGIKIIRVPCIRFPLVKTLSAYFKLRKQILLEKADVYNPHDWSSGFLFLSRKLKKLPYILTSHGFIGDYLHPPFFAKKVEEFVFRFTKAPIKCVQKSSGTGYLKKYKMDYIPNGVNSNLFTPSKKNKVGKYALFVGSLDERKNIKRVCEAFKKNYLKLKIVGSGPFEKGLKKKYSKNKNILFLGRKEGRELIKLFQECKFFILPSTAEGFGLVWLEAQSCGKPIITTPVGVGPDLIINKDFGRLVKNPKNQMEINKAIFSLNKQINQKGIASNKIRRNILTNYSWDSIAEKYLKEFQRIIK